MLTRFMDVFVEYWARESGVWNDLAHTEDGKLHTAVTSYEELYKFAMMAYHSGVEAGKNNL